VRFVWAVAAFVLAAVMIAAGIAQRTIFQAPPAESAVIPVAAEDARFTVIDGGVLNAFPGSQTLTARGDGQVFAAYGRTLDVQAWLSDVPYTSVTLADDGEIVARTVEPEIVEPEPTADPEATEEDAPAPDESAADDAEAEEDAGRNPVGSDLWLDEYRQEARLSAPLQLPDTMSVLIASDGTEPAPTDVSLTWPVERTTPWAGPLIVGGGIVLLVGIFLYILGIRHARRSRGPRRKGLPMPATQPIDLADEQAEKGVISSGDAAGRRAIRGRRRFVAVPAIAMSAVLLAGCAPDAWPQFGAEATPSPTASVIVPEGQQEPAVTMAQAERILARVAGTVAEADAGRDGDLAATRLDGAALAERLTNYRLRGELEDQAAVPAIPDSPVQIVLPQQSDTWPRSFLTVVENAEDATVAPAMMLLTQEDPWSEYKATTVASLGAATELPDLPAAYVGSVLAPPDSAFLLLRPDELAAAYADIIDNGEESEYASLFDTADDELLPSIAADRQRRLDELNETGRNTAELQFRSSSSSAEPLALTTQDGGAIVAVGVTETDEVRPTNEDAVIRLENSPQVRVLTGVEQSATGFTQTFGDQLFFYVPLEGSGERIRLLGYQSNILEASVIE
jgi:hypothetical protein